METKDSSASTSPSDEPGIFDIFGYHDDDADQKPSTPEEFAALCEELGVKLPPMPVPPPSAPVTPSPTTHVQPLKMSKVAMYIYVALAIFIALCIMPAFYII